MDRAAGSPGPLQGYRVLDLADEKGEVCAWTLGALGADVIQIEPIAGSTARHRAPYRGDDPGLDRSLAWLAYNTNKRSLALDIEDERGRDILRKLVSTADFFVESFAPGHLAKVGLDYPALKAINPRLIGVSITHFGQTGPYRGYAGSDLVHQALSSLIHNSGEAERPPVRVSIPQAYCMAGSHAAAGALLALAHRHLSGEGQHVDQSIQHSMLIAAHNHAQYFEANGYIAKRLGVRSMSAANLDSIVQCKDGWIVIGFMFAGSRCTLQAIADWMKTYGEGDVVHTVDWTKHTTKSVERLGTDLIDRVNEELASFFIKLTKKELNAGAVERQLFLYAASTTEDLYGMEQLAARNYFVEVADHDDGRTYRYPGAFAILSETPVSIAKRAPHVGEHSGEVLAEIGIKGGALRELHRAGVVGGAL